jgi:hypothetical protein
MPHSVCTFNVNNLFVRYRFGQTFPGDIAGKSAVTNPEFGYLPIYDPDLFELFNPLQRELPSLRATVIAATEPPRWRPRRSRWRSRSAR